MNKYLMILGAMLLGSCHSLSTSPDRTYSIYIESWERIAFERPLITEGGYSKMHTKRQAESVLSVHQSQMSAMAEVMLGKNLHINDKRFESEISEIQDWLVSKGITTITFRVAMSDQMPPVVREYRNGKIIRPNKMIEDTACKLAEPQH